MQYESQFEKDISSLKFDSLFQIADIPVVAYRWIDEGCPFDNQSRFERVVASFVDGSSDEILAMIHNLNDQHQLSLQDSSDTPQTRQNAEIVEPKAVSKIETEGQRSKPKRKSSARRGRKVVRDLDADRRLVRDWEAAKRKGEVRERFCANKDIKVKELEGAQRSVNRNSSSA